MATSSNENINKRPRDDETIPVLIRFGIENRPVQYIYIHKNEFKIGRGLDNDEIIQNTCVSRSHCIFKKINDNEWTLTNLSSSPSGILVNDKKIEEPRILKAGDVIQLLPTPELTFTVKFGYSDESDSKMIKLMSNECLMDTVKQKQDSFSAHQDMEIKKMQEQIELKEQAQNLLKSRLNELIKNHEEVQGKFEEKNEEIKNLQNQIQAGNNQQNEIKTNLTNLLLRLDEERQQFEKTLTAEKKKWQDEVNMTKQEKEQLEKKMEQQMNLWKEQQLAALAKDKDALQLKLNQTENAFKEQQALAEKLQVSLQNQQVVMDSLAPIILVDNDGSEQTIEILETIDLTNDDDKNLSCNKEKKDKMTKAMDEQFTCSICSELFYKATTVNCSHTFCQYCINEWRKRSRECPICRTIVTSMNRALVLDNFIDEAVVNLSPADQERRNQLIRERYSPEKPVNLKNGRMKVAKRR
ncbi:hypothetical protein HCN44_000165 [Aphidius gifuensis]|uniref:E3 ubiquitin-protein ligase CHFR n=1 Tax=Aphidius gifuensis TaxID=684658 RepID=A0A834XNH8_APHGI|nr:E3 ubiquitin-protein ligase rnf8-like [Aphidius gifuensis]KAF7990360.1 hypothetical protein HCN44_000165 [Aphidius gifuensis]